MRFLQIGFPWILTVFVHLLAAEDWDALRHVIALSGFSTWHHWLLSASHTNFAWCSNLSNPRCRFQGHAFHLLLFWILEMVCWKSFWFKDVDANCLCASFTRHVVHRVCALRTKVNNNRVNGHCYNFVYLCGSFKCLFRVKGCEIDGNIRNY